VRENVFVQGNKSCRLLSGFRVINSPCETAGLEQLRVRVIREEPGASDESSQCLLFILLDVVVVVLPQFEVDDALLLSAKRKHKRKTLVDCEINHRSLSRLIGRTRET
jgi:hypothetical protein